MTEDKFKRVVVASTVGAVVLLVVLLSVMIFQLIKIGVETKKRDELNKEIAHYHQLIEDQDLVIEARSSYAWIVNRAKELGYAFDGDYIYPNK